MISKRLTKIQKDEIVEAYRDGENTNTLAEKFGCTSNTINRTVKTLLSDSEYQLLKEKRLKSGNIKFDPVNDKSFGSKEENTKINNDIELYPVKVELKEEEKLTNDDDFHNSDFEEIAFLPIKDLSDPDNQNNESLDSNESYQENNDIEERVSLSTEFDLEKKQLDFEVLNQDMLPESVYMLVDKKIELEVKPISEFPEWSFLPENELRRNALLLFSNQRAAKRSCSRNQRVIKIPNTNVFKVSKSYLVYKGITRLILEDSIIAIDN